MGDQGLSRLLGFISFGPANCLGNRTTLSRCEGLGLAAGVQSVLNWSCRENTSSCLFTKARLLILYCCEVWGCRQLVYLFDRLVHVWACLKDRYVYLSLRTKWSVLIETVRKSPLPVMAGGCQRWVGPLISLNQLIIIICLTVKARSTEICLKGRFLYQSTEGLFGLGWCKLKSIMSRRKEYAKKLK